MWDKFLNLLSRLTIVLLILILLTAWAIGKAVNWIKEQM